MVRAAVACAIVGAVLAVLNAEWRSLPEALAARGLQVVPSSVHWLDSPGLKPRRALLLARSHNGLNDLYVVTARTGFGDRVITLEDISNLTRSRDAEEESLVVQGDHAVFVSRVGGQVVAFTVVDTRGDPTEMPSDMGARWRIAITRLQQTGRTAGYGIERFDLVRPVSSVRCTLTDSTLDVQMDNERVRVDLGTRRVVRGSALVHQRPRRAAQSGNWVTWLVDTVRAISWIGPEPIAWAEGIAFRAQNVVARARVAAMGDDSEREVAEDLADVLNVRASTSLEGPVHNWPPAPLRGPIAPALPREGQWSAVAQGDDPFVRTNPGAPPPMYITFLRTDPERLDARVYVTVWDPRQIELHVAPGSEEPMGATGETGTGAIPRDEGTMLRLVAGFNGAFQALHGEFGVYAEGTLLLPPKPYAATVALLADGSTAFGTWPRDLREIPHQIVEFRQNLTPLVDEGVWNPWRRGFWGGVWASPSTPAGELHTARSALCMTREGYVAYFWGASLTPRALGDALLAARCTYGIHLDMNGANTGFELYRAGPAGSHPPLGRRLVSGYEAEGTISGMPGYTFRARKLVRGMPHALPRYIRRDPRDFFYLLLRPVLPGPALQPVVQPAQPGEGTWHVAGLGDVPFPWPMARTRIRPDPGHPDRWVNLVRIDARRVALAPPDARDGVIARFVGVPLATGDELRITMSQGMQGPRWVIGRAGDGIAGVALQPGMAVSRGAGIDAQGFLVLAVADRAVPDLVARALDRAGCGPERIALAGGALALASGQGAAGETVPSTAVPTLALVVREFPLAQRIFPEVRPVPPSVWYPVQHRQVRYMLNPAQSGTMQVRLVGQDVVVLPLRGVNRTDAGVPPASGNHLPGR